MERGHKPADGVDPEDEDEDENDRLLVLDQPAATGIVVVANIWTGGGAGDCCAGVFQLENLEQLLCGEFFFF